MYTLGIYFKSRNSGWSAIFHGFYSTNVNFAFYISRDPPPYGLDEISRRCRCFAFPIWSCCIHTGGFHNQNLLRFFSSRLSHPSSFPIPPFFCTVNLLRFHVEVLFPSRFFIVVAHFCFNKRHEMN